MVDPRVVKRQLQIIGADGGIFGRPERRELPRILFEDEELHHLINGRYSGGGATLCATNQRVLLIDKKPLYLTMEDIRFDMISDVMFNHRMLDATVLLGTMHKSISFTAFNSPKLRELTNFVQEKILEARTVQSNNNVHGNEQVKDRRDPLASPELRMPTQARYNSMYKLPVVTRRRASKYY